MSDNDLILYTTDDGEAQFSLREMGGTVWLTQLEMAELFQGTKQNISLHIGNIFKEGELSERATVKEYLTVQNEGEREIRRQVTHYALSMIIAVGYRVRSPLATQFRQWATRTLGEYMLKGFVLNDERLKEPRWDYFDELLERIRDIRASEKRFYQKVRDLLALAEDYRADEQETQLLFAEVQNKMFFAVTGSTAAELIVKRADASITSMGLTSWKGQRVRKADIVLAKNYLQADELDYLNRIVTMFLEFAELRARQKQHLRIDDWRKYVDSFMEFNEQPLLDNAGSISQKQMKAVAGARYEEFDGQRKAAEAVLEDKRDLEALEELEKTLKIKQGKDRV